MERQSITIGDSEPAVNWPDREEQRYKERDRGEASRNLEAFLAQYEPSDLESAQATLGLSQDAGLSEIRSKLKEIAILEAKITTVEERDMTALNFEMKKYDLPFADTVTRAAVTLGRSRDALITTPEVTSSRIAGVLVFARNSDGKIDGDYLPARRIKQKPDETDQTQAFLAYRHGRIIYDAQKRLKLFPNYYFKGLNDPNNEILYLGPIKPKDETADLDTIRFSKRSDTPERIQLYVGKRRPPRVYDEVISV